MAQLSDDCFAFGGPLRRLDEALDDLLPRLRPAVGTVVRPLFDASGAALAADIVAGFDVPAFANSAVDGYAVAHADLSDEAETQLLLSGRAPAGRRDVPALAPGTAMRIFTGAVLPDGADTVFMQEDAREDGGSVLLPPGLKAGAYARAAGEDLARGATVLAAGTRLHPPQIAALAALGHAAVRVREGLRVGVFSTGDEVLPPGAGEPPTRGATYDANRPMLMALLARRGAVPVDLGILPDDAGRLASAFRDASGRVDALLTSGGVSTGEEDHVKAAVEAAGRLDFWRLAIKPGRPIAMGRVGETPIIGLPGNPVAAFVTFLRFAGPVFDALGGATPIRPVALPVRAGFHYRKKEGRREYVRVRLAPGEDGRLTASRFPRDGAALISSLLESDGLAELDETRSAVSPGETVDFFSYASLWG